MKLNTLLEIESSIQQKWRDEKVFEEDAPMVSVLFLMHS